MNEQLIGEVVGEVRAALVGRAWSKVFQLSRAALVIEFRPGDGRFLLLSAEPNRPRLHLIRRAARELEREALPPAPFAQILRRYLTGAMLLSIEQEEGERVVRFRFDTEDETGRSREATLVAQLTGRTANLFLLDESERVVDSLRPARGAGQETGNVYLPPARNLPAPPVPPATTPDATDAHGTRAGASAPSADASSTRAGGREREISRRGFDSLSEALDAHYCEEERARAFDQRANAAASKLRQEVARLAKLRSNLERDLAAHGDADQHKRVGDLLLANLANAEREGGRVLVTDYFADDAPLIELEIDENKTLQEEAAERFARYQKAKRAAQEVERRLEEVGRELSRLALRQAELERIIEERDYSALEEFSGGGDAAQTGAQRAKGAKGARGIGGAKKAKKGAAEGVPGARRYRSSDGYEILVGRGSRDNDHLTFRVARSYDLWLHTADYPGSHVVVRARGRDDDIPHRTIVEAAQLAAHFSRAAKDSKVAVNYAPRKFISKPKGAAPGLVYLSSFRTLMVEPREALERV
jgi:predicted ribosome quality control (RQC) complex YloA/Tae2 family protein